MAGWRTACFGFFDMNSPRVSIRNQQIVVRQHNGCSTHVTTPEARRHIARNSGLGESFSVSATVTGSLLAQQGINQPATSNMRLFTTTVSQDIRFITPGVLKRICEDRKAVECFLVVNPSGQSTDG